jgi:hypothetical protein
MKYGNRWPETAAAVKQRAGMQCEYVYSTGRRCTQTRTLECHHVSYERFGKESPFDLVCLCRLHHKKIHGRI